MVCPTCLAIRAVLEAGGMDYEKAARIGDKVGKPIEKKVKRTASAYARRYGAAFKRLKKKHPRMSFKALAKKAHKEARRK